MTIAIDFDGVIHRYSKGWSNGTIYDPPMDGAIAGLSKLMEGDAVFIFTSRNAMQVADWLAQFNFRVTTDDTKFRHDTVWDGTFWNQRGTLLVTNRKLGASVYIDDRAIRFVSWPQVLFDLEEMRKETAVIRTDEVIDSRIPRDPLQAEHVLQLIHRKRSSGKSPEQILETVETWLYGVAVTGGVVIGSSETESDEGTDVSA